MRIFAGVPREGDVKCNAMLWAYTRVHTFNKKMVSYLLRVVTSETVSHGQRSRSMIECFETKEGRIGVTVNATFLSAVRWSHIYDHRRFCRGFGRVCRDFQLSPWFCLKAVKISMLYTICVISAFERSLVYDDVIKFDTASRGSLCDSTAFVMTAVALLLVRSLFWKANISQGSVTTCFRCGGNCIDHFYCKLLANVTVKKF